MNFEYAGGILLGSLHAMVPITLTASGEVVGESAGLFNIGLEGIILISAMTGALGAEAGGPMAGLLVGLGTGFVIGLIFAAVCTYFKGVQLIAGVGINLFAAGLVAFWLIHLGVPGHHALAAEHQLANIATPFGDLSPMIFVAIALPVLIYLLLFRTKLGLKIRAVGENPQAADVAGIRIHLLRLLATAAGASLAGLAGAYLSIDWLGSVTKEISAGRGFIALATVVFSGLNPLLVLLGGFIFGFFDNLAVWVATMPAVQKIIPWQFIAMAPYAVTLLVVAGVIGRAKFPAAMGIPYQRE
ncbi:MAG: ABC transporter permease [Deltaproteobacteria bacterium]|jgi:simple sugar transport system permease protein|nr:ABC transporter permease [Deltaproteobacteria bacterium]MBW2468366.1 ABC transporter permease [Deltaproteobacteria bacterium]MBW2487656.1 ABC transporter permease [Deltaproteobacteria bacterium]MBW2515496.1 ABC transporter permease [Deltaproteobacteria bacterium]